MTNPKLYLTAKKLQERYACSPATIYRWTKDPKLSFPKPLVVHGRKYFDAEAIDAWERSHALTTALGKTESDHPEE
jgi:predicted DNA-binding transcriptional regulator AlpA